MKCPFLKEERVCSCQRSPVRKQIPRAAIHEADEKCLTSAHVDCALVRDRQPLGRTVGRCPYLQETVVQYCDAAPVRSFIPCNDDTFSRCNGDAHRYCVTYLQRVRPSRGRPGPGGPDRGSQAIAMPRHLAFSRNHMWLDASGDGSFHVGVDAFLARVLGRVDGASLVSEQGWQSPTAVLTTHGVDLPLTFPAKVDVKAGNTLLRTHPGAVCEDPYGRGWLFEGQLAQPRNGDTDRTAGLLRGPEAAGWMHRETERMTGFVHDLIGRRAGRGEALVADGGAFGPGLADHLDREELLRLYSLFFAPRSE